MMFWYGGHWGWWQSALSLLAMLGFWGLVAWGVYAVARGPHRTPPPNDRQDALGILDERLARGEIDQEQYREMRELMRTGRGTAAAGWGQP